MSTNYVSPTGSATWTQSININTPCSVSTALINAIADDVIYFLEGTYNIDSGQWYIPSLNPTNSGNSGHPITFAANPGSVVTLTNPSGSPLGAYYKNYLIFDGFVTQGGAFFAGATDVTIQNCDIIGDHIICDYDSHPLLNIKENSINILIRNNKIHGQYCTGGTGTPEETNAIAIYDVTNLIVEHNDFYNNNLGIYEIQGNNNNIYRYNIFHDNYIGGMRIYNQGDPSTKTKIYQNIFYNNTNYDIQLYWNVDATSIYNNTLSYLSISNLDVTNWSVWNNIISGWFGWEPNPNGIYNNYNNYYPNSIPSGGGSNSININPNFIDATNHNYHRTSYSNDGRGGIYASVMGAYITGNEIIGVTSTTCPNVGIYFNVSWIIEL